MRCRAAIHGLKEDGDPKVLPVEEGVRSHPRRQPGTELGLHSVEFRSPAPLEGAPLMTGSKECLSCRPNASRKDIGSRRWMGECARRCCGEKLSYERRVPKRVHIIRRVGGISASPPGAHMGISDK
jgi:hypothetical protein